MGSTDDTQGRDRLEEVKALHPGKFVREERIFEKIRPGHRIFVGTGCGEPQHLVHALIKYVESHPRAFFDAEIFHVWSLGVSPYTQDKFRHNFRYNSFFVGDNTRDPVNKGLADYTPVFLSQVPKLLRRRLIPIDVALIQVSPPDSHGFVSLGISVDIVKSAVENAGIVVAQINGRAPRVHGDTFIHVKDIDFIVAHDEPLLEFESSPPTEIAERIGKHVARIVEDGDTIQVGYGSIPNAILANLSHKKDLGVHTELFSEGIADLMKKGVVTNSRKEIDRGKTVAAFCMGKEDTYTFIHDNPSVEFRTIDYTNNPAVIARLRNITAINSALEIDLTGQATAESIGKTFYSGVGGQADFMRGATLAPGGKTILVLQSTALNGTVSRIVPFLKEGAGVTLTRGDIEYVVTEYGIAYLHGKNIRERAMAMISIAHPRFQASLIEEAKKQSLIYGDQAFISGKGGEYPEDLEAFKTARSGLRVLLRPVRISDEPALKDFFYSLSEGTRHKRFMQAPSRMPHETLQESFVVIDYREQMIILSILQHKRKEVIAGVAQFTANEGSHTAEVAIVIRDEYQNKGIGTELLTHLTYIAKKQGLLGFSADVLKDNRPMLHLFEKVGFNIEKTAKSDIYTLSLGFKEA
jgi:acyl-CoA hydrolase/RimJ/RimL family protein N-acetyltransferase